MTSGDTLTEGQLTINGQGFDAAGALWSEQGGSADTITPGESVTLTGVSPGFFIDLVWFPSGQQEAVRLASKRGPAPPQEEEENEGQTEQSE
jgi:hypothetical protein